MLVLSGIFVAFLIFFSQNVEGKILHKQRGPPRNIAPNPRALQPEWGYIDMPVDHNNPIDHRTWTMRYLNNSQHFKPGGPILIFLGGEWEINESYLQGGNAFDVAEQNNAYMFYTEHRYYGKSYPTENITTENLRYLSADQALEDLAFFIQSKKEEISELSESKVVVVGGSYSATLATWARLKYPHLVDIAWASSAPLRAELDFYEYFEIVGRELSRANPDCTLIIQQAIQQAERMIQTEEGRKELSETFNTCKTIKYEEPYNWYFFSTIGDLFAGTVQYAQGDDIKNLCDDLLGYDGTPMDKLARFVRDSFNDCMSDYDDFIDFLSDIGKPFNVERVWLHQTCAEFGFFQTLFDNWPFGNSWSLTLYFHYCLDVYGEEAFYPQVPYDAIERTNIVYGSTKPSLSKVVFVHGSVDPWHTLGVLESDTEDVVAIYVNGSSHCADLSSVGKNDIEELKAAKLKVQEVIAKWLEE